MLPEPNKLWFISTNFNATNTYGTGVSPENRKVTVVESQRNVINLANCRRALDDGIEHRLHIRRRTADDSEHLGRCGLMLQGFAQFCVALAEFLEQPHILNGNDGLVGEGFQKSDLLF